MSQKLEFANKAGDTLSAQLDLPEFDPKAYAIFAHCFTCSKETFAASRVSRALTGQGIAVLRFDFTGLGSSGGDFAETGFTSGVADLVSAADFLTKNYQAPQLLIGHSFGGAAVLAAAGKIPSIDAVVTIGAPSHIDHVLKNISGDLQNIEEGRNIPVRIAGREFEISKNFVDDISSQSYIDNIKALHKPLLIFHAPLDEVVSIDNATDIFVAAKHPKSFVSLDKADHLLSDRKDAVYVADVTAAWASRYLKASSAETAEGEVKHHGDVLTVTETGFSKFQQKVTFGKHSFFADEPVKVGGTDTGPSPYDLLSAALGACTSMTMRMYADHKGYKVGRLSVDVSHAKIHAKDCEDCGEGVSGRIDRFERSIRIGGEVSGEIRQKLLMIADRCPVHKTLLHSSVIATRLQDD